MPETDDEQRAALREQLEAWLARRLDADRVHIGRLDTPEGVGHSNETVLLDATWTADGEAHAAPFVARLETVGDGVFPSYDLELQVECLARVAAASGVPVPRVRWLELDRAILGRAFYVMDRVDGVVPADRMPYTIDGWLHDATPEQQGTLWWSSLETMAELHHLDWRAAGFDRLDRGEHGPPGLAQQFAWWEHYQHWMLAGRDHPTLDAAHAWLRGNLPDDPPPTGLNWGDARISNMMYRDFRPVAVLDWEMAALGPAEVDLAWFVFFQRFFSEGIGVDDLPGFPDAAASVARYAELLGRELHDLRWYEVFAAWRHSSVMARLADLYEATGDIPAGTDAARNNIATRMLATMLDLPSPGEPGGPFG